MADFFSVCSPVNFDINLMDIGLDLSHSESILCEGCNIIAIYKDEKGTIYLGGRIDSEIVLKPVKIYDPFSYLVII